MFHVPYCVGQCLERRVMVWRLDQLWLFCPPETFPSSGLKIVQPVFPALPSHVHRHLCVLNSLSLAPHPNVISAVAIDDSQPTTMPILLPMADCDFLTVLMTGGWAMSELFRQVDAVAVAKYVFVHAGCLTSPINLVISCCYRSLSIESELRLCCVSLFVFFGPKR